MFSLYALENNVRIEPKQLGKPTEFAIAEVLQKTFTNKVLHGVGLVIAVYDILEVGEGAVYHSDGGVHYKVTFRVVVFSPRQGEFLKGTVKSTNEIGIKINLGFFDDVFVPHEMLQQPARYLEDTKEWTWTMEEDGLPLYYTVGKEIRCRVHSVEYHPIPSKAMQQEQKDVGVPVEGTRANPHVPMTVTARCDGTGLGLVSWDWGAGE